VKILHFADAHLGADDTGPIVPETGLSTRLTDYLRSLDAIAGYVEQHEIDLVAFAGDAFHTSRPNPTFERAFALFTRRISLSVPIVEIPGNHDMPGAWGKAHTIEIYRALEVDNVYLIDRPRLVRIPTEAGEIQVVAIPWPTRHNVMASEKVAGIPKEEVNRLIAETVAQTIRQLANELDPDVPAILLGHLGVEGGDMGGGTPVGLGGGIDLPLEAVALPQFDYVALGHLHRYQQLYDNPPVVYSGSIERIDFGEEKEEKGFVVVEFGKQRDELFADGAATTVEFVPLPVRKFQTITVHLDGDDPTDQVMQSIHEHEIGGAVVRLIVEGSSYTAALLDDGAIRRALEPALSYKINKQIDRDTRTRLEGRSYQEMAPLELLGAYLDGNGRDPGEREALMKAAEELMKEVAA